MKNVVKMFVAVAVMGVLSVSAFAQGAGPGGPAAGQKGGKQGGKQGGGGGGGGMRRGGNLDAEVLAKLNLTEAQKGKVKALKEATQKKVQELFKSAGGGKPGAGGPGGPGGPGGGMREKMKPIMDGYQSGMKAILTPTQYKDYEKGVKEAREKMRAQFGGGPGGPGAGGKGAGKGKGKGTPPPSI